MEEIMAAAALWPSWHYDVGRAVYWYLCTHHLAYFIHPASETYAPQGTCNLPSAVLFEKCNHGEINEYQGNSPCFCKHNWSMADVPLSSCPVKSPCCYENYEANASTAYVPSSSSSCPADENGPSLPSGWVEDFLIECYLGGSFGTGESAVSKKQQEDRLCMDNGMSEEPTLYDSYAVDVETPVGTQTLNHEDNVLYSIALQQENEDDCLHRSEKTEGFEEAIDEDKRLLEAWQAQYGQVVRSDAEAQLCPRAINLWNWTTVVLKGKGKSKSSICLLGQLAQTPSRLHPSSHHQNGFMKTTCICEVNLDLVKVSSGELYRLRQPSSKYLSSVAMYDSSNPTKGWNFPCISFSGLEDIEGHAECVSNAASKLSLVAKPFVPNLGHQRYQHPNKRKIAAPTIPEGLRAFSRKEIASVEERKQKYRDRAKERRELHGVHTVHALHQNNQELCFLMKDTNNGWEKESKRHLTAQHMLEKMGWCEGEGLGKRKDGLKEPLSETSNRGRAGIGWFPKPLSLNKCVDYLISIVYTERSVCVCEFVTKICVRSGKEGMMRSNSQVDIE